MNTALKWIQILTVVFVVNALFYYFELVSVFMAFAGFFLYIVLRILFEWWIARNQRKIVVILIATDMFEIANVARASGEPGNFALLPKDLHPVAFEIVWEYRGKELTLDVPGVITAIYDVIDPLITDEVIKEYNQLNG